MRKEQQAALGEWKAIEEDPQCEIIDNHRRYVTSVALAPCGGRVSCWGKRGSQKDKVESQESTSRTCERKVRRLKQSY